MNKNISRRKFLKLFGAGTVATTAVMVGCKDKKTEQMEEEYKNQVEPPTGKMTYRLNPKTNEKVSLLGYGMMRLPTIGGKTSARESDEGIDQEQVNRLVDYAIEHGVNYFDTSPAYCQGHSEESTGIALSRHKRSEFFVATKLSNFKEETWPHEESVKMYHDSFKYLQVDYIDYYLLHSVGQGGMERFEERYLKNGMLDFLIAERKAGRIKNLGFSYHGDIAVFDYLLSKHDQYQWDFVQIELNYLDWDYANEVNERNTDARYLYSELQKRHIPAVVMEPLLGGRLANLPQYLAVKVKQRNPQKSIASWAFRYAGTPEGVLTVLSGMTYMEHLKDNLLSYCPLEPVNKADETFLYSIAKQIVGIEAIPCNDCNYCMPCPYGVDIPGIFVHYNKCKNEGTLPHNKQSPDYRKYRRQYLIGLDRVVAPERQADHCIQCGQCVPHCPQNIKIPQRLGKLSELVETLKRDI